MALTPDQIERHKRHLLLKEVGGPGVSKLREARVSIIGAGALGGPCALYLAAAGVGQIELWDDDHVDRSNLQRQVQFAEPDLHLPKAEQLGARLSALNSDTLVQVRTERFGRNAEPSGEILVDATDNFETRFALNALAHRSQRFLVSGAASRWTGQVSVYASGRVSGAPCYQCFVPQLPPTPEACDDVGVMGVLTGIVGTHMALEVIKLVVDAGEPLIGRLLIIDGLTSENRILRLRPNPDCSTCGG